MDLKLPKFLKEISEGDKVAFEFPFFILYLRAITSGTLSRLAMIRFAAEKVIFKHIGKYLDKLIYLTKQWRYPQAKASEILSEEVPTDYFSTFLYKLSQSISSGEPTNKFIEREHKNWVAEYEATRSQSLDRLKNLSDAYLPMMSVTLFLTTTMLISTIFYEAESMIMLTILSVIIISFILYLISWLIYKAAKPEGILLEGQDEKPKWRKRVEIIAYICIAIAAGTLFLPVKDNFYRVTIAGILLTIGGGIGKYYVSKVKAREEDYPSFFRYMCSNLSVDIPLVEVVNAATETDFGTLNEPIMSLYNKLNMRVQPKVAWWSFETELDSQLIRRMNLIMTDTFYTGGNISKASKFLEDFFHTYITLRRKRYQAASYHTGILIPLYAVMAGLFGVIDGFFTALIDFVEKISEMVSFLSVPPMSFIRLFFVFALVLFALNNVYSLYNMEGDSRYTVLFYFGLQLSIGGILYIIVSGQVTKYLGSIATK